MGVQIARNFADGEQKTFEIGATTEYQVIINCTSAKTVELVGTFVLKKIFKTVPAKERGK